MLKLDKKLLILSYTFPPFSGIGGRRWTKLAKFLARKGWQIYVIAAKLDVEKNSPWIKDIQHENIKVYFIPTYYPSILTKTPKRLTQKIEYHFWWNYLKLKNKGRVFDETSFFAKELITKAEEVIETQRIKNLVCTIPQFGMASIATKIKARNRSLNFILDYRDPWTDNKTFHGFEGLPEKRWKFEFKTEQLAIKNADWVVSSTPQMTGWAKQKAKNKEKCITILNGYDFEDFDINPLNRKRVNGTLKLSYVGSLYPSLEYILIPFLKEIKSLEKKHNNFPFEINFYGRISDNYLGLFSEYKLNSVKHHGLKNMQELSDIYINSDAFLMFSVKDHGFAFNTKFYEYLAFKKPIIHFGQSGEVSDFLEANNLGTGISPLNMEKLLFKVLNDLNYNFGFNHSFDISQYNVSVLANKFEALLIQ